jgi:hypothetical protein
MLKKGLRAGFGTMAKGLYAKYEQALRDEEAEADLLRKQHLASYEDSLLTNRAMKVAEKENEFATERIKLEDELSVGRIELQADITDKQKDSGFRLGDRVVSVGQLEQMDDATKEQLVKASDYALGMEEKKQLKQIETAEKIVKTDAANLHDSLSKRKGMEDLPPKEEFVENILFISRASKGSTPLSNSEKIDLIKEANKAWETMSTGGGEEYDALIAKHGPNARKQFIEGFLNDSMFGGTSLGEKAGGLISGTREERIKQEIKDADFEDAIDRIMKTQGADRPAAIKMWEEITGRTYIAGTPMKKRPGLLQRSGVYTGKSEEEKAEKLEQIKKTKKFEIPYNL